MRLAVIGPVPPFRSGVAKHTGHLAKALEAFGSVRVFSFSRQYPSVLFPGEDDRDEDTAADAPADTHYLIDTLSTRSWRDTKTALDRFAPDIAVIPAWTFFTAPVLTAIASHLRMCGVKVVTIAHNVSDHEGAAWKRMLLTRQIAQSDAILTHTGPLAMAAAQVNPMSPIGVSPHPLFDYPEPKGSLERRARLELLMFGLLRPYKGADLLIAAMDGCRDLDVRLSIVGESWGGGGMLERQVKRLGLEDRIDLVDRYVSDSEAAEYFHRADALVLPYRSVTGSGVVPLAMRYGRPIIASDLPGFREMVRFHETGWRFPNGDVGALTDLIRQRYGRGDCAELAPSIAEERKRMTWSAFATAVMELVEAEPGARLSPIVHQKAL